MSEVIQVVGLKEVLAKLEHAGKLKEVQAAVLACAEHIKGVVDVYPPSTIANSPMARTWYERGYGPRWRRKNGTIGGTKSSQMLGRKWTTRQVGKYSAEVGNNVSYAKYVQDLDNQKSFHGARGWPTIQQVAEDEREFIIKTIVEAIQKSLQDGATNG